MAKRAFLVGINRYQIAGADLRGCVNDVKDLSAALVEFHGFRKADITVVTDLSATKKAMEAGIKAMIRDSKKGDVALIHYSGHGSHVPDDNKDEADGRIEGKLLRLSEERDALSAVRRNRAGADVRRRDPVRPGVSAAGAGGHSVDLHRVQRHLSGEVRGRAWAVNFKFETGPKILRVPVAYPCP